MHKSGNGAVSQNEGSDGPKQERKISVRCHRVVLLTETLVERYMYVNVLE